MSEENNNGVTTMSPLQQPILALRELIGFDAAQLVAFLPSQKRHVSLWHQGYSPASIDALADQFPRLYPPGFTRQLSPRDRLPPSISECAGKMFPPFLATSVYRSALHPQGFQDGMTIELGIEGRHLGLAHFSSCTPGAFNQRVRTLARGAQPLLEAALRERLPALHADQSVPVYFNRQPGRQALYAPRPPAGLDHQRMARALASLKDDTLTAFWLEGRRAFRLHAQKLAGEDVLATLTPTPLPMNMTSAEMRVLSWLAAGLGDRDIARRLCLSERTVHSHVASLLRRLGVQRRAQLSAQAAANNWFVPDARGLILASVPGLGH